jgi:hypothetical protein
VAREESQRAAGLAGGNFADWGAGMVFNFKDQGPYDASAYAGLRFHGRSAQGPLDLHVTVPDSSSAPAGGKCGSESTPCYHHYRAPITLNTEWQEYEIAFASLTRDNGGGALDRSAVFAVEFVLPGKTSFEFAIDDVYFVW